MASDQEDEVTGAHAEGPLPPSAWGEFIRKFDSEMSVKFVGFVTVWFAAILTLLELTNPHVMIAFGMAVMVSMLMTME